MCEPQPVWGSYDYFQALTKVSVNGEIDIQLQSKNGEDWKTCATDGSESDAPIVFVVTDDNGSVICLGVASCGNKIHDQIRKLLNFGITDSFPNHLLQADQAISIHSFRFSCFDTMGEEPIIAAEIAFEIRNSTGDWPRAHLDFGFGRNKRAIKSAQLCMDILEDFKRNHSKTQTIEIVKVFHDQIYKKFDAGVSHISSIAR